MNKKVSFRWLLTLLALSFNNLIFASCSDPAQQQIPGIHAPTTLSKTPEWTITTDKKEVNVGDEITITFTSTIEKGWYMYSSDFDPNLGPIAAEFTFEKNKTVKAIGAIAAVGSKKHYEEVWKGDVSIFTGKAVFKQKIKILTDKPVIKGAIYFQECSEETGVCMPPYDYPFEVKVNVIASATGAETTPTEIPATAETDSAAASQLNDTTKSAAASSTPASNNDATPSEGGFIGFLLLSFLGGLVAVATPCVFPMLPMTVSFFTKRSETRTQGITRAFTFGLSIVGIYASLGLVFAFFGLGPDFGNWLSTHWLPNILFFIVFMVFAASFLGAFEITLPHQFVNKVDSKSSMSSFMGIFFMAFTLALVSFSCTGPIVGSLLIEAVGGKFMKPLLGMAAFGAGLALPFTLFAMFPSWLQNLPKSGGWLNSVKVVLGFAEIALAFKFLSIPDIVYHWRILDREIYLAIWIVLAILLGLYLLGKLKFSHDNDLPHLGVPRFFLAMVSFVFAVYMIPGLFGAPLKGLSGLIPPMHTQEQWNIGGGGNHNSSGSAETQNNNIKHADFLSLPHGLTGYFDYKQALEESRKQNKPIFIDFTGHACVNCRKMEEYVWAEPAVLSRLKNDFIIVSLYADERNQAA
jgi:thiol:disulfide interchange protein